jgi:hypothetical protein
MEKPCHWSLGLQPGRDLSKFHNLLIQQTVKPTSPTDHFIIHLSEENSQSRWGRTCEPWYPWYSPCVASLSKYKIQKRIND